MAGINVTVPKADLRRVEDAQARFLDTLRELSDDDVERLSGLPEWTVGHVLTHVARNADSHCRRSHAAARGEVVEQYAGGYAGRAAEVEFGARRSARELVDDVRTSSDALRTVWRDLPDAAWTRLTLDVGGRERPLNLLPARRWQELEVHVVDLGVGRTHRDWPDEFVQSWLPLLRAGAEARLPEGARLPEPGVVDERDELAWLYGRLRRSDLPELAPWG
jgi:maleylpyruvate isomerase